MQRPLPFLALPLLMITACAATNPVRDAGDVVAFNQEIAFLDANTTRTPTTALPTGGFIRYDGQLGADILINGEDGYGILGDLTMDVEYAGARAVSGTVDNIDLLVNGVPNQLLAGDLDIAGQQASGKIDAAADGLLTRTTDSGFRETTNLHLDMSGTVQTDVFSADTVLGTVNDAGSFGDGAGTGLPPLQTFNVLLDGDGAFYGQD